MYDASEVALGVGPGQKSDKNFHPINYASKALNGAQNLQCDKAGVNSNYFFL